MITHNDFTHDKTKLNLYFDRYMYKFSLDIVDVQWFRHVRTRKQFLSRISDMLERGVFEAHTDAMQIKLFIDWRIQSDTSEYVARMHTNNVTVYTSDLDLIESLRCLYTASELVTLKAKYLYAERAVGYEKGIIYHVKPKHKFRVYLKGRRYTNEERKELYDYLASKPIKIGESLKNWFQHSYNNTGYWWGAGVYWSYMNHCFDLDDESLITMLYLKFDDTIGKVCEIHKKINT